MFSAVLLHCTLLRASATVPRGSRLVAQSAADDSFASQELARTWERTGKGKRCWQPGDATGDTRDDARLLFTSWRLTPLRLRTRPGCLDCVRCQLVLSHIGLPFRCEAAEGEFAPALFGAGVGISDNAGIAGVEEICEFAEANGAAMAATMRDVTPLAPPSGRAEVLEWLEEARAAALGGDDDLTGLLDRLAGLLGGGGDGSESKVQFGARAAQRARLAAAYASLSNGGFGLEDAAALAALSALASRAGGTHHWPEAARDYFEESRACRQAGLLKQPQGV